MMALFGGESIFTTGFVGVVCSVLLSFLHVLNVRRTNRV